MFFVLVNELVKRRRQWKSVINCVLTPVFKGFNTKKRVSRENRFVKGYISQLENDSSSPSMDTFFDILEVLNCHAADTDEGPERGADL